MHTLTMQVTADFPFQLQLALHSGGYDVTLSDQRVDICEGVSLYTEVLSKNGMFYRDISFQEGQKTKLQKSSQTGICLFANILRFCFDIHKQAYCNIFMK